MYTALSRTTKLEYIRIDKPARYYCKPKEYPSVVVNSYFNDDYHNGQVYKISFELIDKLYVGCSIRNLQQWLDEHINDKKSPVFKYRNMKPTIRPIICCPCKDRKEINKVEAEHTHHYAITYGDRLLNKQHVSKLQPVPKIHHAEIENDQKLWQRVRDKFGDKIEIKDDPMNKLLYYDDKIVVSAMLQKHVTQGSFYEPELLPAKQDVFRIEKVTRRDYKKKQTLVKWLGYSNDFNSWIPLSSVQDLCN